MKFSIGFLGLDIEFRGILHEPKRENDQEK